VTLAIIAGAHGLDPLALAAFNGLPDIDTLPAGQRLRIPVTNAAVDLTAEDMSASAPIEPNVERPRR
jgi:hypothetical protein